ncbi:MAG: hypothetical protein IJT72_02420 [Lachnospiraceae bacterium]|nr:hypothetical protein [Lachnospiraceae bacterium]
MGKDAVINATKQPENVTFTPVQVEEQQQDFFSVKLQNHITEFERKEQEQDNFFAEESYETEEEHERKIYGNYYDLSKHMTDIRHYHLSKVIREERSADKAIDNKYSEFSALYKSLKPEIRNKFMPVASYINNVFEETEILKKYIDDIIKKPEPRLEEEKIIYQKNILQEISKVNYIKNQHALSMRMIISYLKNFKNDKFIEKDEQSEHIISVFGSLFTGFGELKDAKYREEDAENAVLRAEAIKSMLLRHGSKNAVKSTTPEERVEEIRKKLVDDCVKKLNQASNKELEEREEALEPYKERFNKLISHDENNVFSPFWIPLSMKSEDEEKDTKEKAKKDEVKVTLTKDQLDIMNEASLNRFVLSSLCENIKTNNPNSAGAKIAEQFDKAVIGFTSTIERYSYDAHEQTESILSDEKRSNTNKEEELRKIRNRLVELSRYHGQVCDRMSEILGVIGRKWTGDTISDKEEAILSVIEKAGEKLKSIIEPADDLKEMPVNLEASDERCEKAIIALDHFERYSTGIILSTARLKDKKTGLITGDTDRRAGENIEKQFGSEIRFIDIARRYRRDNILNISEEMGDVKIQVEAKGTQQVQTQQTQEEQSQQQQEKVSRISSIAEGLQKHIPEKEMTKLKKFEFKKGEFKSVGKCRAFWLRHGFVSDGKLKAAVDTHIDRMLLSEELNDKDLAIAASNIGSSTEVISDEMFNKKLKGKEKTVLYTRLNAFKTLSEKTDEKGIFGYSKDVIEMLGAADIDEELDLSDEYFENYPQSLKVVLLYKLIKDISVPGEDKKSIEIRDRIDAAKSGIEKLYNALRQSDNYKAAMTRQNDKNINVNYNSLTDMMFRDRKDLADDEIETVSDWAGYLDKNINKTVEGLKIREKHSEEGKKVIDEVADNAEEDLKKIQEAEYNKKVERVKSNYERILRRVEEYTPVDRYKEIVREPVAIPDYIAKVGAGAFEGLLKMNLKTMIIKRFKDAGLETFYANDEGNIYAQAKEYAINSGYTGIKKESDLGELTLEQLKEFAALVSIRLSEYPKLLSAVCKKMKIASPMDLSKEQREYVLSQTFAGKNLVLDDVFATLEVIKNRREFLDHNKYAVLIGGKETISPRFYNDITKLKYNTSGKDEIRAENRISRMDELDEMIANACKEAGVQMPKSFYEFAVEKRIEEETARRKLDKPAEAGDNDTTKETSETTHGIFTPAKQIETPKSKKKKTKKEEPQNKIIGMTEEQLVSAYKAYIVNDWYNSVIPPSGNAKLDMVRDALSKDGFFKSKQDKSHFKYYGILKNGAAVSGALGAVKITSGNKTEEMDLLNDTQRSVFEAKLATNMLDKFVNKEVAARVYCNQKNIEYTETLNKQLQMFYNDEKFEDKMMIAINGLAGNDSKDLNVYLERRDKRVKMIKDSGYGLLLPILFESEKFTDHLVGDSEEEYNHFYKHYFKRAKKVVELIAVQPYGEQYLIGKKAEILSFIFDVTDKNLTAKDHLNLDAYNNEIESTVLKDNITLKQVVSAAITKRTEEGMSNKKKDRIRVEEGNLYLMALLFDGIGAVLDENKMAAYRKRVSANTSELKNALNAVFEEKIASGYKYSKKKIEAIKESISQNERKNLFMVKEEEYKDGLTQRIRDWVDKIEEIDNKEAENTVRRKNIENNMQRLLNIKKAGRLRFEEYHAQTDKMRRICEAEYKNMVEEKGSRAKADEHFKNMINGFSKEIKTMISIFIDTESKQLPKNGALNAFYNETLSRMAYHVSHEGKEQAELDLKLDHNRFYNVRSFYDIADNFLKQNEMTKDYEESTRDNIIGGLLNFYGQQLLSESYLVTADVINKELEKMFDKDTVGNEIAGLLEHDSGGYYAVGSDGYNYGETPLLAVNKKDFDDKLSKEAGKNNKFKKEFDDYNSLKPEVKILVEHLLIRDANSYDYGGFFVRAALEKTIQETSRSDVVLSYMKGEKLSEPDYKQVIDILTVNGKLSADRLHNAIFLAKDIDEMRQVDGLSVDKETYKNLIEDVNKDKIKETVDGEYALNQIEEVEAVAEAVARDFQVEKYRTNIDKMWSFYTVLRPFKNEIKAYGSVHRSLSNKTIDDTKNELEQVTDEAKRKEINDRSEKRLARLRKANQIFKNFERLESYVNLMRSNEQIKEKISSAATKEKEKDEAWKNAYKTRYEMSRLESYFYSDLGLTVSLSQMNRDNEKLKNGTASTADYKKALSKNTEYTKDGFSDFLDKQVFRVDGTKTKSSIRRTDDDESFFPENVVSAVREIDKWIAKNGNSLSRGNSESTFAADILGHPMRERLFVYYMVEKQHMDTPTGLDAAMAVNGYVPNIDKFCEAINAPKYKIHQYIISAIKDTDFVREHESVRSALAGFGTINLESIESAIRLLDDDKMQISDQLVNYKEALKTDYSEILTRHPENVKLKNYLEARRDKQEKLKMMLFSLEKSRELAQISDEAVINKKEKLEAAQKQALEMRMNMIMLIDAEKKLTQSKFELNGELKNDRDLQKTFESEIGRKIYNPDDDQSTSETIDGYMDKINTVAGLLSTADDSLFESGIFATVNGITAFSKVITTCFATDFKSDERSVNQKITDATTIMDAIADAAEPVSEMIKSIVGSSSELFGTVGGVISSGLTAVTGTIETVQAAANQHTVNKSKKSRTEKTKKMIKEAEKTGDKNKVREAKELARAAYNVGRMQDNKYGTREVQSALKATGGAVSLATALIPGLNVAGAVAGGIISAVSFIHKFYKEKENRNDALDFFLGMDKLIEEYKNSKGVMNYGTKDDKELIRNMMLRKFHFSSAEQFFNDLSMKYARHLYDQIFFKSDGTMIREGDTDEIAARKEFTDLFPELKFIWPAEGGAPHPSVEEMAADLMKLS